MYQVQGPSPAPLSQLRASLIPSLLYSPRAALVALDPGLLLNPLPLSPLLGCPSLAVQIFPARTCLIQGLKLYPGKHVMSAEHSGLHPEEVRRMGKQTLGAGNRSWRNSCCLHLHLLRPTSPPLSLSCPGRLRGGVHWAGFQHLRAVALIRSGHVTPPPHPWLRQGHSGRPDPRCNWAATGKLDWQGRKGPSRSSLLSHPWGRVRAITMHFLSPPGPVPGWTPGDLHWLRRMMRSQDIDLERGRLQGSMRHSEMKPLLWKLFSYMLYMYHVEFHSLPVRWSGHIYIPSL